MDESKVALNPWLNYLFTYIYLYFLFGCNELTIGCYDDFTSTTCPKWGLSLQILDHTLKPLLSNHHFTWWYKLLSQNI
jgi:hypothetical protein